MEKFTYCANKLELVEGKIEKLKSDFKSRRTELLGKKEKDDAEKQELADYDSDLTELKKDKNYWQDELKEVTSQQQGLLDD